ncbi:MAG: DUF421 domain-containing protein [Oscillospiraceae bacterium]|nr:DUF421 domain-containing protein [Oscillospiraceae bacterium]
MTIMVIRTFILYIVVIFSVRFMGKRQIGQMQPTELVITILISNIATISLENTDAPLTTGIVPILFLISVEVIMSIITLRYQTFRNLVSGTPQIIIKNGTLDQKKLKALRMSIDDVLEALREINIFDISEVQFAIVETNGKISAYQKAPYRNVTQNDINGIMHNCDPPYIIINDGKLLPKGQYAAGITVKKLEKILKENKTKTQDIFLMTSDRFGNYNIIKKQKGC